MPVAIEGWRRVALIAALLPLAMLSSGAQAGPGAPIRIAWDANADVVAGYRVHVGFRSRGYEQNYDVQTETSFTYGGTERGRRYYFAVTAYSADGVESSLSSEVSAIAGAPTTPDPVPGDQTTTRVTPAADAAEGVSALCADGTGCFGVHVLANGLDAVTSLGVHGDGTVFLVEEGQRVRVLSANAAASVSLVAALPSRILDVVPDPASAETRDVYVGLLNLRDDRLSDFLIARYRWLDGQLTDPAVVVPGLSADDGTARLTMDRSGRLYVALSASRQGSRADPYAGRILRFNRDGTVPDDSRAASPILAEGFRQPMGLGVHGARLWASGRDDRWPDMLMHLALDGAPANGPWPRALEPMSTLARQAVQSRVAADDDVTAYIDAAGELHILDISVGLMRKVQLRDAHGDLVPEAVVSSTRSDVYVAVRQSDGSFSILRLTRTMF